MYNLNRIKMLTKLLYLFIYLLFLWTTVDDTKLLGNELISSSTFTDTQISPSSSAFNSLSFLQERITAQFSTRYIKDSNVFLRDIGDEASILNGSVLLGINGGGLSDEPGLSYKLLYGGNYFSSLTDNFKYNSPADHSILSGIELRGAFTTLSINANIEEQGGYSRSEPFTDALTSIYGEARYIGYKKKRVDFGVSRELSHGELALGISFDQYEYNTDNLIFRSYERDRFATDLSWFHDPTFLSKTSIGIGLTAGKEEITPSLFGSQIFFAPSLRLKWNYSTKTAFAGWVGVDKRSRGSDDFDNSTPVFGLKGFWKAPTDTQFTFDIIKQVDPSIYELDDNVATKKISVSASQKFGAGFDIGLRYLYEFSDYQPTLNSDTLRFRTEDLQNLRISLGKSLNLGPLNDAKISFFYNILSNDSTKDKYDYDRNQYGLQYKFSL